jgi:hypothetical protein
MTADESSAACTFGRPRREAPDIARVFRHTSGGERTESLIYRIHPMEQSLPTRVIDEVARYGVR